MNKNNEALNDRWNKVANLRNDYNRAVADYLNAAFAERKEYKMPDWLKQAAVNGDNDIPIVWCDYRHDGAWVKVTGVSCGNSPYSYMVDGQENMEYMQDDVKNCFCYDRAEIAEFVSWWIALDVDAQLDALRETVTTWTGTDEELEEAVSGWAERNLYAGEYISIDSVKAWAKA